MPTRRTAPRSDDRRVAVLHAAVAEFARNGLPAGSTARIAADAQIAHSYLFKLFGSKKALFLAATGQVYDRISARFRCAAAENPDDPLSAIGAAYRDLLHERSDLLMLLHGFAAADDPDIGTAVRGHYIALYRLVEQHSDGDDQRMRSFSAHGMLMTIAAAIDLPSLAHAQPWITGLLTPQESGKTP